MSNVRIQVDFSRERVSELEKVMKLCGMSTKKELLNNALSLFEWAVREVMRGRAVASVDEEDQKYRELQMPTLQYAARHAGEAHRYERTVSRY
jgi:hypothetical protein